MSRTSISRIVREVCGALWLALQKKYMPEPSTKQEWDVISQEYEEEWDFPHALGAVDGKHIEIECPPGEGSNCYNYLKYHSIVLMAISDARYRFIYVDIGSFGHQNDAAIFSSTDIYSRFDKGIEEIPSPRDVNGHMLPFTLLGDDIFALKPWLQKPFPGKNVDEDEKVYNYRLSRARRTVENAFGILRARWRIFSRPIKGKLDLIDGVVKACVCLHNYLLLHVNAKYLPPGFVDSDDGSGHMIPGQWREMVRNDARPALRPLRAQGSHNYGFDAKQTRTAFKNYVNSPEGSLSWQLKHVRATH